MMAAIVLWSRSVPRCVGRASFCMQKVGNSKSSTCAHQRQNIPGFAFHRSHCKIENIKTIHGTVRRSQLSRDRQIHSSAFLCQDFQIINTPPFADSITEGDVTWEKAVGDVVEMDEVVAQIETDKTTIHVHTPVAGIIEELYVADGEKVEAKQKLFKINTSGDALAKLPTAPPLDAPKAAPTEATPPTPAAPIPTTPPPIPAVPTSPLKSVPTSSIPVTPAVPSAPGAVSSLRSEQRVKMNRMRLRIAQRLKEAQNVCAMLTTFNEIDMSNIMEMRVKHKDAFLKKHGMKLGFMSAFIKASSYALIDQPVVNGVIDGAEIVYRDYVDISVAVATPKGLVVPVLRNVESMNFADIEKGIFELGEKARSSNLAIEDMDGGTFTISNGGVFGSMFGTPIINPPQSAILGMHGIFDRPVAVKGKVEIRPMMYVALTYDHRLVDGREAVTFLRKIKSAVEDPLVLLMDL